MRQENLRRVFFFFFEVKKLLLDSDQGRGVPCHSHRSCQSPRTFFSLPCSPNQQPRRPHGSSLAQFRTSSPRLERCGHRWRASPRRRACRNLTSLLLARRRCQFNPCEPAPHPTTARAPPSHRRWAGPFFRRARARERTQRARSPALEAASQPLPLPRAKQLLF